MGHHETIMSIFQRTHFNDFLLICSYIILLSCSSLQPSMSLSLIPLKFIASLKLLFTHTQLNEWVGRKIYANYTSDSELACRLYEEQKILKWNKQTTSLKCGLQYQTGFSKQKLQMDRKHVQKCSKSYHLWGNTNQKYFDSLPYRSHGDHHQEHKC